MKNFVQEFKAFAMKGNVIDLAVGIIIGSAFGKVVSSMVADILMPIIGKILGRINIAALSYTIIEKSATSEGFYLKYGSFLQSIIDFVIIAFCIFMLIKLMSAFKKKEEVVAEKIVPTAQEKLLSEIRDLLKDSKSK